MKQLYQIKFIRKLLLPIFKKYNLGDISIKHHWVDKKIKLHSFLHKGYWYHGKNRETKSMNLFLELINTGDFVIEVGGHIGYISLFFSELIGENGQLVVFEPGVNNLPYILNNTKSNKNIKVIKKGISNYTGNAEFYIDELSGQNNSLIKNYYRFETNKGNSGIDFKKNKLDKISCTTLDDFLVDFKNNTPSFLKIDVEGAELQVLQGMNDLLKKDDIIMMVEVTENSEEVFSILLENGFNMFNENKKAINSADNLQGNIFCLKKTHNKISNFISN